MGSGVVCVQMSWISCPVQSHVARYNMRGNWSTGSLLNWSRVSKRQGMVSPQALQSGTSDGEDSDSWFWSRRDDFGPYPWDSSWDSPDKDGWIREDTVTFFTTDGLVKIGGSIRPSFLFYWKQVAELQEALTLPVALASFSSKRKQSQLRRRRFREEDYMDPKQGLCLGAIFDIAATNGLDRGRRFCVFGFCRSVEMLNDVVEDTVLDLGGEVVAAEKATTEGLHEKLTMTVVMPLLWGVPPAVDTLNHAIRSGGGIVEKTYKQWHFL